jgi:hypothetical protein
VRTRLSAAAPQVAVLGSLEVFISEVDQAWLEQHLGMLAVLVSETELDAGGVRLRVNV